jgi:hypothetical protein
MINIDTTYVVYKGVNNYGVIYGATFGRGLISLDQFQKPVGINDPARPMTGNTFLIYPNPAHDRITVAYETTASANVSYIIFDFMGKQVKSADLGYKTTGKHEAIVNCGDLKAGTYILQLTLGDKSSASKFIIQ